MRCQITQTTTIILASDLRGGIFCFPLKKFPQNNLNSLLTGNKSRVILPRENKQPTPYYEMTHIFIEDLSDPDEKVTELIDLTESELDFHGHPVRVEEVQKLGAITMGKVFYTYGWGDDCPAHIQGVHYGKNRCRKCGQLENNLGIKELRDQLIEKRKALQAESEEIAIILKLLDSNIRLLSEHIPQQQ